MSEKELKAFRNLSTFSTKYIVNKKASSENDIATMFVYIAKLEEEVERLNKARKFDIEYNKNLQKEIIRLNNIINTMLDFNFFKEECPLNFGYTEKCDEEKAQDVFYEDDYCEENCNDDYKKCWLKYFKRLQELKEK